MAESAETRVGKFTIEEATSAPSQDSATEAIRQEVQSKSPQDSVDAFTLKTSQTKRRGRPPGSKAKPVIQAVSEAPANHALWAQLLIGSTNTVVVTWLGQDCAMERREAEMLEPPIARILARLPPGDAEKLSVFIDPMVILIAMGTWANRIIRVQRAKRATISDAELARASGMVVDRPSPPVEETETREEVYQPTVGSDLPPRTRVPVNPNGVPVAITQQIREV